jgi:hypothetical protein
MMSVRPICEAEGAFLHRVRWTNDRPGSRAVDEIDRVPDHMLHRLPGLFRRWELAQVIEAGKHYHIENAGSASDGTTLYAIYASPAVGPETEIDKGSELPSRPGSTRRRTGWGRHESCAATQRTEPGERRLNPDTIQPMKAAR